LSERCVVLLHGRVEIIALDRNPVLRAFELRLERLEGFRRAELGIIFAHHQKSRKRGAQLPLRLLEFFQLSRVRWSLIRVKFYLAHAGARICHFGQRRFFKIGRALHGLDEIRNQIGATLIDRLHVRPFLVHVLLQRDETIVSSATAQAEECQRCEQ